MSGFESGLWLRPYYTTELGIGFAGHCFEAMSIIALFQRCVEQLVADGTHCPLPEPNRLAGMLAEIATGWFRGHQSELAKEVEFLLFGFAPVGGAPWAAMVKKRNGQDVQLGEFSHPLESQGVYSIGDVGQSQNFKMQVAKIRRCIQRHAKGLKKGDGPDDLFEWELDVAKHSSAAKKSVEQFVRDAILDELKTTVGGAMQKVEVYKRDKNSGVLSFSRDLTPHMLDGLSAVGDRLAYTQLLEPMGRF
jgi:hypothetical protein